MAPMMYMWWPRSHPTLNVPSRQVSIDLPPSLTTLPRTRALSLSRSRNKASPKNLSQAFPSRRCRPSLYGGRLAALSLDNHSRQRGHWRPRSDSHVHARRAPRHAARISARAGRGRCGDPSLVSPDATRVLLPWGLGPRTARDWRRADRDRRSAIRRGRARWVHALGLAHNP